MGDIVFNVAKGREAYYGSLPGANDALIAVFLEASGLVDDATMKDYDTLAQLLAGASNEQTTIGRQTLTNVQVVVNDTTDRTEIDADDFIKLAAAGNVIGAVVVCYDPDTTAGTDADLIPQSKHDYPYEPDGLTDLLVTVAGLVNCT